MRRIALLVLGAFAASAFLFAGAAWAPTITLVVHNESSQDVRIVVFQAPPSGIQRHGLPSTLRHEVIPHGSFHATGIEPESCVLVRVAHDSGVANTTCRDNATPLDVRCDVSSHYACAVHRGQGMDVVVKLL